MVLQSLREEQIDHFPQDQFVEFLRKFNDKIWQVFITRGIADEKGFPVTFIRSVLHTCIRFFFVQGMNAPDPSKLATLPHVTMCERHLKRRIQYVSHITQDQFQMFPDWLLHEANSVGNTTPRPKQFRSIPSLTRPGTPRTSRTPRKFFDSPRRRTPALARTRSQGDFDPLARKKHFYKTKTRPVFTKVFKRPITLQNSWSSSFRSSNESRKTGTPYSHGRWLTNEDHTDEPYSRIVLEVFDHFEEHFDPTPSANSLDDDTPSGDTLDGEDDSIDEADVDQECISKELEISALTKDPEGLSAFQYTVSTAPSLVSALSLDPRMDPDYISVLSVISDSDSLEVKSDSCIPAMRKRTPATPLEPQELKFFPIRVCHSDESISISRPATRPHSRQVSESNIIAYDGLYMKVGSPDTYESLHRVYKFVSDMENGLFQSKYCQYAGILLKNRISWNMLTACEVDDLTDLGIPRIHSRFILTEVRKIVVE